MTNDENVDKQKATVAIANSIMAQISLSDVLKLVHGNVIAQAREHVDNLSEEEFDKLITTLESIPEDGPGEQEEPHAPATKQAVTQEV